jgi:hypothetical protein
MTGIAGQTLALQGRHCCFLPCFAYYTTIIYIYFRPHRPPFKAQQCRVMDIQPQAMPQ